jgi:uncharacterized protein
VTSGVLVDTGPLVAIFSAQDAHHGKCVSQLSAIDHPMLTCWPVLTEAFWTLRDRPAAIQSLLRSFGEDGLLRLATLDEADLPGIARILQTYASLRTQLADATLLHLAEREQLRTIFTLDRRDFTVYRLSRNRPLHLIP